MVERACDEDKKEEVSVIEELELATTKDPDGRQEHEGEGNPGYDADSDPGVP